MDLSLKDRILSIGSSSLSCAELSDTLPSWHWVSSFEWGGNNIPTSKDGRNLLRCCLWESTIWDQPIVSASRAPYRALETQALGLNYNPGTQVFYNFHIIDEANRGSGKLHFFFSITQLGGKWAGAQNLDYWFWTLASVYMPCVSFSKSAVGHSLERVRKWLQGAWGYSPHLLRGRIETTHLAFQKPKRQSPNSLASYERHPMVGFYALVQMFASRPHHLTLWAQIIQNLHFPKYTYCFIAPQICSCCRNLPFSTPPFFTTVIITCHKSV